MKNYVGLANQQVLVSVNPSRGKSLGFHWIETFSNLKNGFFLFDVFEMKIISHQRN